jgi:putative nucleotidyltransferase with HDIG domain
MENLACNRIKGLLKENNQESPQIMIVDDEEPIRRILGRLLKVNGNTCQLAANAAEARTLLRGQNFDLILCDVVMPGESGIDFIRYVLSDYPETAVIMVTAVNDPEVAETALEIGAYGYIIKPFNADELLINVCNALRRRKLEIENRRHRENLEKLVLERTDTLKNTLNDLQKAMDGIIEAMGLTVETRDPYTAGHQRRVAAIARAIAIEMGLSERQVEGVCMAGLIHDIGKISIPAEILSKPGKMTEHEFGIIKSHPKVGYNILKKIHFPWPIAQIVYQHHERMDGSGYPQGLSGKDILLETRIMAVADVVEAMSSHRPYRPALGIDIALEEISKNRGALYDSEVAGACLRLFKPKLSDFLLNLHQFLAYQGLTKSLDISIGMPPIFANLAASKSWHISSQKIAQLRSRERV